MVSRDEGVSARDFLLFLWRNRWLALLGGAIGLAAAIGAVLIATPRYTATVLLLPVSGRSDAAGLGSLSSSTAQLSGLASLAGLSLNGTGGPTAEAVATLQSEILTDRYVNEHDLLPVLFAKEWDPVTKVWKVHDPGKLPTLWQANQLFKHGIRTVTEDPKTGLVTLAIKWTDRDLASQWANGLVEMTNDYLRQRAIDEAERNIAYLNEELAKTNILELKDAIYSMIEQEINKEMVARGRKDFALRVVDPAVPPEQKSYPRPVLWVGGGLIAGVFLSFLMAVLRETMVEERDQHPEPVAVAVHAAGLDTRR